MPRLTRLRWLLLVTALMPVLALARSPSRPSLQIQMLPGQPRIVLASHGTHPSRVAAPAPHIAASPQSASFVVTYNGFSPQAQQAFQRAVDIWSGLISSPVPIHVNATWTSLPTGVLGAAGPENLVRNFSNAPLTNTWYPAALANKLAGQDLNGNDMEIEALFNSTFSDWYFGTDGQTPFDKYDFVTVVLHELGHGLGFYPSMDYSGSTGSWGHGSISPYVFDRFIVNGASQNLIETSLFPNPSTALGAQLVSANLFFSGPNAGAAAGGGRPRLYAPAQWRSGSSIAHLDEATYPTSNLNSLMTPALQNGASIHNPGPITLGIFQDIGWTLVPSDTPISGLAAANNGPTQLGSPTGLTATIGGGTNVTYAWDFGDGSGGSGANVSHSYAATGSYRAVVTATNASGSATAETNVSVVDVPIQGLQASSNGPTNLGNMTTLAATIGSGTNVIYDWDFGDGSGGSGATAAHLYQHQGSYSVGVTAHNPSGSATSSIVVQVLPSGASDAISGGSGGTLATQDGSFQAAFPAGGVAGTIYVTYTAYMTASQPLPNDMLMVRDFTLEASTSAGAAVTHFDQPITIVLRYTDAELAQRDVAEQSLQVVYWNGSAWASLLPCSGCAIDSSADSVTLVLQDIGEFALIGKGQQQVLLPLVRR